ncbi:MAG: Gfo/Idh/MocA family oxidoreductase [Bryobacterales bacterium]|nr:Gfo/Idh/MocA family oxidoreductase [Bryobacterales bacterium]
MSAQTPSPSAPSRRAFVAAATAFPAIVPATVLGQSAPSNRIQVAQIGCGRIARYSEFPGVFRNHDLARFVAVADVDRTRLADAKTAIEAEYAKRFGSANNAGIRTFSDYREMLADPSIDAVCISTPDHWHAQPAMEAALAGKDIYLQKPTSLTVEEGRHMADIVKRTGRILQLGSQQRSDLQWRLACELVRNGRIGTVKEILIGLPYDPAGGSVAQQTVPSVLDYDFWLGSTPQVHYTEDRVHPQKGDLSARYDRPGWLRCEQFGAGMITGWGTHHVDIAHWAMDLELAGPSEITAHAEFPAAGSGLWDVHGNYHVRMLYPNGAAMYISDYYPNGVRFVGEDGWIWVTRGKYSQGEPAVGARSKVLDAHDPRMLRDGLKAHETRLHASPRNDHHRDWLEAIRSRKQPVTNAEVGHRSCTACLLGHIAMRVKGQLKWDATAERFTNSDEANRMLARPQRAPYGTHAVLKKAGISLRSSAGA